MMFSLGIIDKLTKLDLTAGRFIAGTGEITARGQVQPIGGIQQKMVGARNAWRHHLPDPRVQLRGHQGRRAQGLRLVKVSTLNQAVTYLEALKSGHPDSVPSC
jgi:PDZ domain-containing protein